MPYLAPKQTGTALAFLRDQNPKIIAGCTDFFPGLAPGQAHENILDVSAIADLSGITVTQTGWRIGAATTWTDVIKTPLPPVFDCLKQAAREIGSRQIQNQGTVAGNICNASPAADGVPPLLVLNAQVEIASLSGRRLVPLSAFITGIRRVDLGGDEMVLAVHIPRLTDKATSAFIKLGGRAHLVISIATVAAVARVEDGIITTARLSVGSCSPVAQRLPALEARLQGVAVTALADMAFDDGDCLAPLTPISDIRGSGEYRLDVVADLCRRAMQRAVAGG